LITPWHQADIGSDVAALFKAIRPFEGEHKGQGGDGADAGDLPHPLGFGKLNFAHLLDLFVAGFDPFIEEGEGLQAR
jgi:hypothetical protein